ncbi:MAG: squalene/phytoene synthase family protein [Alphaproteobacteria bacterium]|nr:squalene/phytoene synthase family protein [Alphaproteobacteria bacterium]
MRATWEADAAACAELVRTCDFLRYAITLFASPQERRALLALHAFNVEISRVRDRVKLPLAGEIRLQWWADLITGEGHGDVMASPMAAELQAAIFGFALPLHDLLRLIEARRLTLDGAPMATMACLEDHLIEATAPLFAVSARIRGADLAPDHEVLAHASLALGLHSVLVRERYLLPAECVRGADGAPTPDVRTRLLGSARQHLEAAFSGLSRLPAAARPAFLELSVLRHELKALSGATDPIPASRLRILWTLWRAQNR